MRNVILSAYSALQFSRNKACRRSTPIQRFLSTARSCPPIAFAFDIVCWFVSPRNSSLYVSRSLYLGWRPLTRTSSPSGCQARSGYVRREQPIPKVRVTSSSKKLDLLMVQGKYPTFSCVQWSDLRTSHWLQRDQLTNGGGVEEHERCKKLSAQLGYSVRTLVFLFFL